MKRKDRKLVVHATLFFTAFFLIIYLGSPSSASKTYPWTKITYKTTSKSLPQTRGICSGLASSTKPALVISRVQDDDSEWLDGLSSFYHLCPYTVDAPLDPRSNILQVPANRGHEAMPYLTFLIDNYASIPATGAVFIHGSRKAWHNDWLEYDNLPLLSSLNVSRALEVNGYHNLRCDWSISTCPMKKAAQGSIETRAQAKLVPWDTRAVSDAALPSSLANLFGEGAKLGGSDALRSQCCAQFVVSREKIWSHSREEYVAIRQWLLDSGKGAAHESDRVAGRVLSYVWHILFMGNEGEGDVNLSRLNRNACPTAADCYCRLYGRCDLPDCDAGKCRGQYSLPKDLKLPEEDPEIQEL